MQGNDLLPAGAGRASGGNTKVVYILYLGGIVIGLLATLVWWIVRCVKGLQRVSRSEPYPNIETWLW